MTFRDKLLAHLDKYYNLYCAHGYANPVPLYLCANALINPSKFGKGFYYSKYSYPKGTCPKAEDLLQRSFLLPFNENYTEEEISEIADRLIAALFDIL